MTLYTAADVAFRRAWVNRPQDAPPVLCGACGNEIRGSYDSLQNARNERLNRRPLALCLKCADTLENELGMSVADAKLEEQTWMPLEPAKEKQPQQAGQPCFTCSTPITGTP